MAVDVYSENLGFISPRLSFSNDLKNDETTTNITPSDLNFSIAETAFDFAFNVDSSFSFQPSTADELFSNGRILPTRLKQEEEEEIRPALVPCLDHPSPAAAKKKSLKEFLEDNIEEEQEEPNTTARPFWKFRRSSSLNSDRSQRKGLIGSLKVLSRSGSTGKFLEKIVEENDIKKGHRKSFWKFNLVNVNVDCNATRRITTTQCSLAKRRPGKVDVRSPYPCIEQDREAVIISSKILQRSHSTSDSEQFSDYRSNMKPFRRSSSLNCDTQGSSMSSNFLARSYSSGSVPKKEQNVAKSSQKRQLKSHCKGYGYGKGNYNNNVRLSSILNLPSPYISRVTVDFFGFGSLFCNGSTKDRKKRK